MCPHGAALQQEWPHSSAFRTQELDQSRPHRTRTRTPAPSPRVGAATEHSPCRAPQGPMGPTQSPSWERGFTRP